MADKFCTNCGSKVGPADKFCNNCGQALADQQGAAPQAAFTAPPAASEAPAQESAFVAPPAEPEGAFTPPPAEAPQPGAPEAPPAEAAPGAFTPPPEQVEPGSGFTPPPPADQEPAVPPPPAFTPPPAAPKVSVFGQAATAQAPKPTQSTPPPPLTPPAAAQARFTPPPAAGRGVIPPPPITPGLGQAPRGAPLAPPSGAGAVPKKKSSTGCIIGGCVALIVIVAIIIILVLVVFIPRFNSSGLQGLIQSGTAISQTIESPNGTAVRVSTRTPSAQRATVASAGAVLYQDNFNSTDSGWDTWDNSDSVGGYENKTYAIEVKITDTFYWANPGKDFSDFALNVDTEKLSGVDNNHYGVILRYQDNKNFYMFGIASDGYYHFGYYADDVWTDLVEWTASDAINTGDAANHLTVTCVGSNITLSVNGVDLVALTDSTFSSGDIGFFSGALDQAPVKISFDNLVVTTAQ